MEDSDTAGSAYICCSVQTMLALMTNLMNGFALLLQHQLWLLVYARWYLPNVGDFGVKHQDASTVHYLKEDASNAPHVHLVRVVAICEQALRSSVPAGGDVLRIGLLGVDAPTAAKVCQLQALINDEDVFWLDVPVNMQACKLLRVYIRHG